MTAKKHDPVATQRAFEAKISRRSDRDYINALKADLLTKINEVFENEKDLKTILGESKFKKIADYYNEDSGVEIDKSDLSTKQITKSIVWSEFVGLTAKQQTAWSLWNDLGEVDFTDPNTIPGLEAIFVKGSQTMTNILAKAKRKATRFEALYAEKKGYTVTALDIEDATR